MHDSVLCALRQNFFTSAMLCRSVQLFVHSLASVWSVSHMLLITQLHAISFAAHGSCQC